MAQAGLWDLDGDVGLTPVDDPNVARAILRKVNAMNVETAVKVVVPVAVFAALPQSSSVPLVAFAILFAVLYVLQDKIPSSS